MTRLDRLASFANRLGEVFHAAVRAARNEWRLGDMKAPSVPLDCCPRAVSTVDSGPRPKPKCSGWRQMEPDEREGLDERTFCDAEESSASGRPCPRGYCATDSEWHPASADVSTVDSSTPIEGDEGVGARRAESIAARPGLNDQQGGAPTLDEPRWPITGIERQGENPPPPFTRDVQGHPSGIERPARELHAPLCTCETCLGKVVTTPYCGRCMNRGGRPECYFCHRPEAVAKPAPSTSTCADCNGPWRAGHICSKGEGK